ncbi:tRNA 2-selenouridine(34) synthase MnmH [Thiomonas sp. X19]|uniref:tRNA 2-selenouridine(34) synthase MnmH n=1 Tax=Thiomonas sp. X19 TaxID=1050370 RepID=UPI000DDA4434|nr:tRNA 2-selenouridine(34) synthase MnmH [Thiomonas sp. X19]
MSLRSVTADEALTRLAEFDAVLDVRSPGEFTLDHMPGAVNWPVLDDAERVRVGILHVQTGAFEARRIGAALVARNIAMHIEQHAQGWPKEFAPLVYCWRGGNRSGAMAHVLAQIGFRVHLVPGGYKALRAALVRQLDALVPPLNFRVICGPTGSGKSRLLNALQAQGAQVLDLEMLAAHRGSVLGALPGEAQPSQKHFETRIWAVLRSLEPALPVFIESESKRIGKLQVPSALLERMHASPCMRLEATLPTRVRILLDDYAALTRDPAELLFRLESLTELRGKQTVARWRGLVEAGDFPSLVEELLAQHYDPSYGSSMARNYQDLMASPTWLVDDASAAAFDRLATQIIAQV